jgi:hypothetical protein
MAITSGLTGTLSWKGNLINGAYNMSVPQQVDKLDKTTYADGVGGYRRFMTGFKEATASADCKLDNADVANLTLGDEGMLICTQSTGKAVYGTAILYSKSSGVPHDGLNTEALTFTFDGTFLNT